MSHVHTPCAVVAGKVQPKARPQAKAATTKQAAAGRTGRPSEMPSVRARVLFDEFASIPADTSDAWYKKYLGEESDKKIRYMGDALKRFDSVMALCFPRACSCLRAII